MSEVIEHQLHQLNGSAVALVRPNYGTQSDSWTGFLTTVEANEYPYRFQFQFAGGAIIFTSDDVVKIDPPQTLDCKPVIRLKGPQDYRSHLVHA